MNSEIHNINTRNNSNIYQTLSHLTVYHKGPFYMGIKVHNNLPPEIHDLSHSIKKFKSSLRGFLPQHSVYHWKDISIIQQLYDICIYVYRLLNWYLYYIYCMKFWGTFSHVRYILYNIKDDIAALYSFVDCKQYLLIPSRYFWLGLYLYRMRIFMHQYMTGSISVDCYWLWIFGMSKINK
jgi:hypothetical protein